MTATAVQRYTYKDALVPRWEFTTPVAHEGITQYFPVRHFCKWLGIDPHTQVDWLNKDSRFEGALREAPYKTAAGWRPALWIRRDMLAKWLLDIDAKRCKLGSREKLQAFQEDVIRAAETLLFGAAPNAPVEERGHVSTTIRVEVHMNCFDCGAPHYIVHENGQTTVVRVREEGE